MEDDGFLLSIDSVNLILFCVGLLQQTPPLMLTSEYFLFQSSLNLSPKALQLRWFSAEPASWSVPSLNHYEQQRDKDKQACRPEG